MEPDDLKYVPSTLPIIESGGREILLCTENRKACLPCYCVCRTGLQSLRRPRSGGPRPRVGGHGNDGTVDGHPGLFQGSTGDRRHGYGFVDGDNNTGSCAPINERLLTGGQISDLSPRKQWTRYSFTRTVKTVVREEFPPLRRGTRPEDLSPPVRQNVLRGPVNRKG